MRPLNQLRHLWSNSPTIHNILKVSLGDATSKVLGVVTALLLIRGLSILDYANYTTFSGISYLFSGIAGTGINMALVRFSADQLSRGKEKPVNLYFLAILLQVVIYALMAGLCLFFPASSTLLLFGQRALELPLRLGLLAGLGILIIQFARSLYQAEERFNNYIGTLWLAQVLMCVSLAVLWLLRQMSFVPVAMVFVVVQIGIGSWILVRYLKDFKLSHLQRAYSFLTTDLRQFLVSSGWLMGYFLMLNLFSRMDVLTLLHFKGKEELAIYGVAFQYYNLSLLFLGSIHTVLLPKFSKADMQEPGKQKAFLRQWLQWSTWLVIPIILFDAFGKPFFVQLNGGSYEKSFHIFVIFSFGIWLSMMFSPLVNILLGKNQFRFLFSLGIAALCANVLLNLLFVPVLGGTGAAAVVIVTNGIINISAFLKIRLFASVKEAFPPQSKIE